MSEPTKAWALQWPEWTDPSYQIDPVTGSTRADITKRGGRSFMFDGETPQQGWKRAYRKGYRAVRVTVTKDQPND